MIGFACNETPELMPLPISLAHGLCRRLAEARKSGEIRLVAAGRQGQVTVEYHRGKPAASTRSSSRPSMLGDVINEEIRQTIIESVIRQVIPESLLDDETKILINPSGRFVIGGPMADAGLTGRKIIVDTYGGMARHGGGAFSGKDATKVDRSAAYAARYVAKNVVAAGLADRFEVQVSYAIGKARPVSIMIETFGTGRVPDEMILRADRGAFRPAPGGDHRVNVAAPADLPADGRLRSLRPRRPRRALGADRQGRRPGPRRRDCCRITGLTLLTAVDSVTESAVIELRSDRPFRSMTIPVRSTGLRKRRSSAGDDA